MIEAVFQDEVPFLVAAVTLTLAAGLLAFLVSRRRTGPRKAALHGLWAASATGPALLTSWSGGGGATFECAVNPDVMTALTGTQGQLNLLLFVPYGLFATLATRRPLFAAATGALFTLVIETAQTTVPFVSRLCDTDDLVTNTLGACGGAVAGAVLLRLLPAGAPVGRGAVRRTAVVCAPVLALTAVVWLVGVDLVRHPQPTEVPAATPVQAQALERALTEAFGSAYAVGDSMFLDHGDGTGTVSAEVPGGGADLSWPDGERFTALVLPGYEVPSAEGPVTGPEDARKVAVAYAKGYAPWAAGARVTVHREDGEGWTVSWRRLRDGVVMPMRLDVTVAASGHVTGLTARGAADPELPEPRVDEARAWQIFERAQGLRPGEGKRERAVLLAQRRDGPWRVHWLMTVHLGGFAHTGVVDAVDGSAHEVPVADGNDVPLP
ncbi:VanZ family protein [Streptomyces cellulosae]|uniref:VanZ family protein n=1 Tax=Streptomyces cellulosae TaxID=1968 RepID=UPI0022541BEC|nr:VanZ family protein [Streptomyces cellulosae]WTB81683.1 VanZ family protein [Streptomyces cellulosae]WTC55883.1 VanZ family protein [Streptomyces cellulosae]